MRPLPSIHGVEVYVGKATADEKMCIAELKAIICGHLKLQGTDDLSPAIAEKITKLRNISRDVGWMRRLLADLKHEQQLGGLD